MIEIILNKRHNVKVHRSLKCNVQNEINYWFKFKLQVIYSNSIKNKMFYCSSYFCNTCYPLYISGIIVNNE